MHHNMNSSATQVMTTGHRGSLLSFPDELLISVFCYLPSFNEAFVLSSTCHRTQAVWLNNTATIYKHLARPSIPCERHARQFLALQGGPSTESRITSVKEVIQMMKNKNVVERVLRTFENHIVDRVEARNNGKFGDLYSLEPLRHPSYLTRTERSRFIRSYYELWGLMKINDSAELKARLQSMTFQQLLHVQGITSPHGLTDDDQLISPSQYQNFDTSSHEPLKDEISRLRLLHMNQYEILRRMHGYEHSEYTAYTALLSVSTWAEGYYGFIILWDRYQARIKNVVCGNRAKKPSFEQETHWELWDDGSDEDA